MSTVYEQDALTLPAPSGIYSKWLWVKASSKLLKSGQIDIPGERTSWQLVYFTCRSKVLTVEVHSQPSRFTALAISLRWRSFSCECCAVPGFNGWLCNYPGLLRRPEEACWWYHSARNPDLWTTCSQSIRGGSIEACFPCTLNLPTHSAHTFKVFPLVLSHCISVYIFIWLCWYRLYRFKHAQNIGMWRWLLWLLLNNIYILIILTIYVCILLFSL